MTLEQFTKEVKSDSIWWETMTMVHRGKNIDEVLGYAYLDMLSQPERFKNATMNDFKRLVNSWLANKRQPKKSTKINIDDL